MLPARGCVNLSFGERNFGFYGLNMWLQTLLKTLTQAGFGAVGLIATLPYLTAIGLMWVNGALCSSAAPSMPAMC